MIVDMTKPWEESQDKLPKIGVVIQEIMALQSASAARNEVIKSRLYEVETDVTKRLELYYNNVNNEIVAHTSKLGPAHGETKATIGLSVKENLPAASVEDVLNETYKREWCTPQLLSILLNKNLKIDADEYMASGVLPFSAGRVLGRTLSNQIFRTESDVTTSPNAIGQASYLFATEENILLFAEYGQGRVTDFSEGGERAPIGTAEIDIRNGHVYTSKSQPVSLNNLTTSNKFVKKVTGLAWGFGAFNGNFYDSNFHETVPVDDNTETEGTTQEVEATLFDPTMVYKPDYPFYARNFNSTKHNFDELYLYEDGLYPMNNSVFLSSNNFISHIANTQLTQQSNRWGIQFDFVTGDVGISDWLPETISRATDKVLSKQATYVVSNTYQKGVSGFTSASAKVTLSSQLPWGVENRNNFEYSNFAFGKVYTTVFLPLNDLITGFDSLSATNQQAFIDAVDKDMLVRITTAWDNEFTKTGMMRIPLYYEVPNTTKSWCAYIDMKFTVGYENESNYVVFTAFNWDASKKPTINAQLDLTNTDGSRFKQWLQTIEDTPLHPKVFKGCFSEVGGHVTAYIVGHRQYICHYKHNITSSRDWILNDLTPVLSDSETIVSVGMFPGNRFYGDNTRILPVYFEGDVITYLTRIRDRKGKYRYGTFTTNSKTFDVISTMRSTESSEINWLDKTTNGNVPVLVDNSNLRSAGINTTAMVFSEVNGFIGYRDHGFNGTKFVPNGVTEIEESLKSRLLIGSGIRNPYAIFFYYNEMLHWSIVSRDGTKNLDGYDACVGAIRVDLLYDLESYTIRELPDLSPKYIWGNIFDDFPEASLQGLEAESFDDVFITNPTGIDTTSTVFMNYPGLDGRYYSYEIISDENGYYYPQALTPKLLNLKEECGYGKTSPYVFFGSYFAPFMQPTKFYLPNSGIYELNCYSAEGTKLYRDYYMGWGSEQPLYVRGENITVNGQSLLLDQCVTIPLTGHNHSGRIFISYYNETFVVYSSAENTLGYPTEPDNSIIFAGYWEKIGDDYSLNFHAPRNITDIQSLDFINSLLPIIDGKQMALDSMGSTFPAMLGKLTGKPRQFYFKKS